MFFEEEANLIMSIPLCLFSPPNEVHISLLTCNEICGDVLISSMMTVEIKFLWNALWHAKNFDLALVLIWNIWKVCNELLWKGSMLPPQEIQLQAHTWLLEFKKWNEVQSKTKADNVLKWKKSEERWIKCIGMGIKNAIGGFIATTTLKLAGITSPMLAEIAAALEAALVVQQLQTEHVILEGNALLVILAIQNNVAANHGPFGHLMDNTRRILQSF
ncbi:hypothetical protein D8674_020591 [Pyrus ussuriensis x Pyrus communis]|uniref:RNase H type-1 domain-containing protein n=1 Tax=Pyrus ussuriensis x Pyrus communis TaxID=2448454 RepID=A0A5N5HK28_9ROSA|nr:hypothetical protein D8674_020591 [Pyrus ussuriensis x Pyrus communis]